VITDNDSTSMNDPRPKPLYLAALTANNLPGDTWGPRRRIHQYGVYAHLLRKPTNNEMPPQQSSVVRNTTNIITGTTNPIFDQELPTNYDNETDPIENF
jgi:hypothetical protein